MPTDYTINLPKGTTGVPLDITVPYGANTGSSYSLPLVGRSAPGYGAIFAENTLKLLNNHAGETPVNPLVGQIWFDSATQNLKVWKGSSWFVISDAQSNSIMPIAFGGTGASTASGALTNLGAVAKAGDTMTGSLTVPSLLKVTQSSNPQTILIGNQDAGGVNHPVAIVGNNAILTIGVGSNWTTGGTVTSGLVLDTNGNSISWKGNSVWHAGNDGTGSGLDADLLDGHDSSYFTNASNLSTGTLPSARLPFTPPHQGGITGGGNNTISFAWATDGSGLLLQVDSTVYGKNWPITAASATAVPFTNLTGLNATYATQSTALQMFTGSPRSNVNSHVRPSYFYYIYPGASTLAPTEFLPSSLTGFDAINSPDLGQYNVGLTVMGSPGNGVRGFQLISNWNFEEAAPAGGLSYRVNDDTGNTSVWGASTTLWDKGNLTSVSQLTNDSNYVTVTTGDSRYALAASGIPAGAVTFFARSSPPTGWLAANGATVSRSSFSALFSAIGTTFGAGDGSTTFKLPDLRGEFIRGWDNGRGVDPSRSFGSWQDYATAPPQTTSASRILGTGSVTSMTNASNPSQIGFARTSKSGEGVTPSGFDSNGSGSEMDVMNVVTGDSETRPRNVALLACIKF